MMFFSRTPSALAAVTYSCSRCEKICARIRWQMPGQDRTPSTTMMRYIRCSTVMRVPMMAERIIANGRNGRPPTTSEMRMMILSTQPPK